MPILWGRKTAVARTVCPSCQSTHVQETERTEFGILFVCTNCWWPFLARTLTHVH